MSPLGVDSTLMPTTESVASMSGSPLAARHSRVDRRKLPDGIKHDWFPTPADPARDYLAHPVRVEPASRLGYLLGQHEVQVNSMHHQGIKQLASGLRASAFAPDGLIEGVEGASGQYLVAVQWHPEELADAHLPHRRLFTDFLEAARGIADCRLQIAD